MQQNPRRKQKFVIARVSPNFPLGFEIFNENIQPNYFQRVTTTLKNLTGDIFPYFRISSITTFLIIMQISIAIFVSHFYLTIKPEKGFTDIIPWILGIFNSGTQNVSIEDIYVFKISSLVYHVIFLLIIVAELEYKSLSSGRFFCLYASTVMFSNIFIIVFWQPTAPLSSNNSATYSLYSYLLFKNHQKIYRKDFENGESFEYSQFSFEDNNGREPVSEASLKDSKIESIYKVLLLSYFIFINESEGQPEFTSYLIAVFMLVILNYFKII